MLLVRTLLPLLLAAPAIAQDTIAPHRTEKSAHEAIDLADLRAHLGFLASDEMSGRLAGSPMERVAARYVATVLTRLGLEPAGKDGYLQPFNLGLRRVLPGTELTVLEHDTGRTYKLGKDYLPLLLSPSSEDLANLEVVFAGYGIRAPEHEYDDYAGIDVSGKAVLVLRGEPGSSDPDSPFDGTETTEHAHFLTKAKHAKEQGAAALMVVNGPVDYRSSIPAGQVSWPSLESASGQPTLLDGLAELASGMEEVQSSNMTAKDIAEQIPKMIQSGLPDSELAVPGISVSRKISAALFRGSEHSLRDLQVAIDESMKPHSVALPSQNKVRMKVVVGRDPQHSNNVVAVLEGSDPELRDEYVVIGAHMDHVGKNTHGEIWNGADDNASGTTALLEVAEALSQDPRPRRSILFIAFGAEEQGLLGSKYWVDHPTVPLESVVAMLNMDMVGRGQTGEVTVMGGGSSAMLQSWLGELDGRNELALVEDEDAETEFFGRSDQANFYAEDIPVVFFSTMLHDDYHKPSDTPDKIDYENMLRIARTVHDLARLVADHDERPAFIRYQPSPDLLGGVGMALDTGLIW